MADMRTNEAGALPKNIRQIGNATGNTRIYLEDYVYTYLHTQEEQPDWKKHGFLLLGRVERVREQTRYFISGLIRLNDEFFKDQVVEFQDKTWTHIYKEMKNYYDDLEVVGWGQDVNSASVSLIAELERIHKQNFNVQKNVMYLLDRMEQEEAFYVFEKNMLQRRDSFYIYYEKNPQMQEYMIESHPARELNISEEEIREPVLSYRDNLLQKKLQQSARRWNGILYATSLMLVLAVCVLGVSTVNNVDKMQKLENRVSRITDTEQQEAAPAMSEGANTENSIESDMEAGIENSMENSAGEEDGALQNALEEEIDTSSPEDASEGVEADEKAVDELVSDSMAQTDQDTDETMSTAALSEAQTYLLQGYYIVQKGDSLIGISKKIYGTGSEAEKICELNGIDDMNKIFVGQKLQLP